MLTEQPRHATADFCRSSMMGLSISLASSQVVALSQGLSSSVYNSLQFSVTQDLGEVGYQLCLARQRDYQLKLLVFLHPGMDMPLDPRRPCTSPAGEAVIIATCATEEVRIAQNYSCFTCVPVVTVSGESKFIQLPSRKLIPSCP